MILPFTTEEIGINAYHALNRIYKIRICLRDEQRNHSPRKGRKRCFSQ